MGDKIHFNSKSIGQNGADHTEMHEIQGEYGPILVSEFVLQKVWLQRRFHFSSLQTVEGHRLQINHTGEWNRIGGPDFWGAHLQIDDEPCKGDVEIHFYQRDWFAHGHQHNPAFNGVRLHVVLYPPAPGDSPAQTLDGRMLPTLVLLPLLLDDLESLVLDEALPAEGDPDPLDIAARLLERPLAGRLEVLRSGARQRWQRKVAQADALLKEKGWPEALHGAVLEALGYSQNRLPMRSLAHTWPLQRLAQACGHPGFEGAERLFAEQMGLWRLGGTRPANHPRQRLQGYCTLLKQIPDWPHVWKKRIPSLLQQPEVSVLTPTSEARRLTSMKLLLKDICEHVFANQLGGSRLQTVIADTLFPFAAAGFDGPERLESLWFHFWTGDVPARLPYILAKAGVLAPPKRPSCNGWTQGMLQFLLNPALCHEDGS